jgi:DNA polymerase V
MIAASDAIQVGDVFKATVRSAYSIPFFAYYVNAGFASPAENYIEKVCDLNELCIVHHESTYFVRVGSDSMLGDRIDRGDWLIMDCAYCTPEQTHNRIVIVQLGEDYAVKRIKYLDENQVILESSNDKYEPIYVHKGEKFSVVGLVTYAFQKIR